MQFQGMDAQTNVKLSQIPIVLAVVRALVLFAGIMLNQDLRHVMTEI